MFFRPLLLSVCCAAASQSYAAEDLAALTARIEAQQQQLDALKNELNKQQAAQQAARQELAAVDAKVSAAPSALASAAARTSLGGYGEAQFYHFDNAPDQYNAYRFVLYVGHQFSDTVRLHSELEIEHALIADTDIGSCTNDPATNKVTCKSNPKPGQVELEQMFIEWQYSPNHALSAGQMILPVGFLSEVHEPDTFYGAKRNPIETNIIPTTWSEGAIKASGQVAAVDGLRYDLMVSTGLKTADASIRASRQKGAKASAEDLAYTGRVRYVNGGLQTGLSYQHQTDISQGTGAKNNAADLIEAHLAYNWQGLGLKALYAQWDVDGLSGTANAQKAKQNGYFIESSYRLGEQLNDFALGLPLDRLGFFARYSNWDNAASANSAGINSNSSVKQWNYGFNYWLVPQVVLKVDVQAQDHFDKSKADEDGFALGLGYSF